jgi:hypothetical protein
VRRIHAGFASNPAPTIASTICAGEHAAGS